VTLLDRSLVHASTAAVGVTGLAFAAFKHLMTSDDPFSAVNHPLQPWALKAHLLAAPVLVFALGFLFKDHVVAKWRNGAPQPARRSGIFIVAAFLPATLTGSLLPLLASGSPRDAVAWAHLGFGVALLAIYGGHLLVVPARKEGGNGAGGNGVTVTGIRIGTKNGPRR